jgi:diguanylate cyclase (GGDEF)-like protein/putative nucleotidyltransferase with HDIG domain
MKIIDMSDYNGGARAYWLATTLVGILALGHAIAGVLELGQVKLLEVGAMVAVVFLACLHPVRIPGTQSFITVDDVFIFITALFLGPHAAVIVAVVAALVGSFRGSRRWTSRIGGPAMMAIAISLSASLFEWGLGSLRDLQLLNTATLLTALLLFSLVHFLLNSLLMTAHQAIKGRAPMLPLWWANYSWASLTYAASASAAGLIYLGIIKYGASSLLAAGPLVAIIFATCHLYFKQADERAKASDRISRLHLATVEALATAIDAKDQITHDHVYRVQVYACGLARHFGLSELDIEALKAGALLHDVGKIAVPDYILNKPGKLTAAEFEKMKVHTIVGAQILERVDFPYPVVPIVRHHHERWDGRGYPDSLKGEQIPMTARILTVVDCFDAVREDRQYRRGMTREEACRFLESNAGTQFDPHVVEAFLANLPEYEQEILSSKARQQPILSESKQAGLSESARSAVPAAGLMPDSSEAPDYVKQINAAHTEVATLYEMARRFSSGIGVTDVVALTVRRIERIVPFTTCVIYLRRDDDSSAVAAYVFGQNAERIRGRSLVAGRGIAGWVVINGRAMSNTDPMLDLGELLGDNEAGYRTAAVYPLASGDETIGALALYTSELNSYTSDHLHLLESVSQLASTGLRQALLHEQNRANAETDSLTGLPNGRALYALLEQEMASARRRDARLAVVTFNLSHMRAINDCFGYQAGDRALVEAARLLRKEATESAMLSRVAGDEFVCVLKDAGRSAAIALAERAQAEIGRLEIEARPGRFARLGLGFGVAEYPMDGQSVDELLGSAVAAMRRSKVAGGQVSPFAAVSEPRLEAVS